VRERIPSGPGWVCIQNGTAFAGANSSAWQKGPICVLSALNIAELPDKSGLGPQWHISISRRGKRPRPTDIRSALRAFGMATAEEDNHHPGVARHFWLPIDPAHRVDCECKVDEEVITESDGYRWTNPRDEACRGCEYERMTGRPCLIHRLTERGGGA
jgi:hypothetical protein